MAPVALIVALQLRTPAQEFPPGYVDPLPILSAASSEIGEATLKCIELFGKEVIPHIKD